MNILDQIHFEEIKRDISYLRTITPSLELQFALIRENPAYVLYINRLYSDVATEANKKLWND